MNKFLKDTFKPYDNQIHNARELCKRRQALLTDHMGAGKCCSVLLAFSVLKAKGKINNLVVLTPLSAYEKEVWKKDIVKFTNFKCISIDDFAKSVGDNPARIEKLLSVYDVIYGKHTHSKIYKYLLADIFAKAPSTILCLDECQAFRNPNSTLTTELKLITLRVPNIWGVSGSTLSKSLEDFYNICNIIRPWYFGSFLQFRNTYCTTKDRYIGKGRKVVEITGVKNEEQFKVAIEPLVIRGESFAQVKWHYINYQLDDFEQKIYRRIAKGIGLDEEMETKDWLDFVLNNEEEEEPPRIKSVDLYSSRFLYLQQAASGILNLDGTQTRTDSTKLRLLKSTVSDILDKKQSVLIYFDYYVSLNAAKNTILELKSKYSFELLESTGENVLDASAVTEAKVKVKPHIILCTKASAESVSYYFINNVIFFQIPTVPSVFSQFVGRITRKNTLFPDDLNCFIFRSRNIDEYKLYVVGSKAAQMELVQGEESNIPPDVKHVLSKKDGLDKLKKLLLWQA